MPEIRASSLTALVYAFRMRNENRHAIAIEGGLVSFRHTYGFAPLVRFIFEGRASLAAKNGDKDLQKR